MQLLEHPISFRLSDDARRRYEAAAAERGMTLSGYLRARLEIDDQIDDHVSQLRLALLDREDTEPVGDVLLPLLLELILLARKQASPAELRAVHQELDRLGIAPWTPAQRPPNTD